MRKFHRRPAIPVNPYRLRGRVCGSRRGVPCAISTASGPAGWWCCCPPYPRLVHQIGKIGCAEFPVPTERALDTRYCFENVPCVLSAAAVAVSKIKPQVLRYSPACRRIRAKVLHVAPFPVSGSERGMPSDPVGGDNQDVGADEAPCTEGNAKPEKSYAQVAHRVVLIGGLQD